MIDTCKFYVPLTNRVLRVLRLALDADHPSVNIYNGRYFFLKHPHGLPDIKVHFNLKNRTFWLEASLPKVLQGHNVFGGNRLEMMCLGVIKLIYAQLRVSFTKNEETQIRETGIRLGRLDIACSFRLESPDTIDPVLEHLYKHFRAEGKAWSAYGREFIETIYNQLHSTRITDKFYNKGRELAVKGRNIPESVPQRRCILEFARDLLRYEVTFRAKELADLGLDYASYWNYDRVKAELAARLARLNLQGAIRPRLRADEFAGLNDNCRTFYRLWAEGANLLKHRKYRTLDRARQHLLEHNQVDIYRRAKTECPVPLREILDPNRAYYVAPKSLLRSGTIFTGRPS